MSLRKGAYVEGDWLFIPVKILYSRTRAIF